MEHSFVINFWNIWNKLIQPNNYQILLLLMELRMFNFQEDFWKCIILNWQSCVALNTQYLYFFSDVYKIFILHQMISSHKMICNIFGSGIYHNPHSIFKSKEQEFHNRNTGIFSGNETRMAGYLVGVHRDFQV